MINKLILTLLLLACTFGVQAYGKAFKTIHVSTKGRDTNDGSADSPLKTLHAAQELVRKFRSQKGNIEVVIQGGIYQLDKLLHFTNEDSAPKGSFTTFKAAEDEEVIISGGKKITNWKKLTEYPEHLPESSHGKVWAAKLDWLNEKTRFHALIHNDEFLPRSSSLKFKANPVKPAGVKKFNYLDDIRLREKFTYNIQLRDWENIEDIEVFIQPSKNWLINVLPLKSIDTSKKVVTLNVPATYTMSGAAQIKNAIDFLDKPGEWCINTKTQMIYYIPKGDQPEENLIATYLDELIRVEGITDSSLAGKNEKPVRGLVFKGLTLTHADRQRWEPEDKGIQHDWNMWDKANGLIRFRSATECRVTDCTFINTASDAVRLDLFAQKISVDHSTFKNLGGVGVLLSGYGPGLKDVNKKNQITHNTITKTGQLFWHSPAVFVWQSGLNLVSNNHVYDLGYTGMVFAGVRRRFFDRLFGDQKNPFAYWGIDKDNREHTRTIRWDEIKELKHGITDWASYEPFAHTRGNIIQFNEIHDCMKILHDGNAIYMSANGNGNKINNNVVYNHPKGGSIRTDDDSHGCTITKNIVFGTKSPLGIRIKGLNVCNNNFLFNAYMTTGRAGNTCDENSTFKYNVFYQTTLGKKFHSALDMVKGPNFNYNTYFNASGKEAAVADDSSIPKKRKKKKSKKGKENSKAEPQDKNSISLDPQFVNLAKGNFSLKPSSPSLKLGTESLPKDLFFRIGPEDSPFIERFLKIKDHLLNPSKVSNKGSDLHL